MPITALEIEEPTRSPQQEPVIVTFAVNDPEVLQAPVSYTHLTLPTILRV